VALAVALARYGERVSPLALPAAVPERGA